MMCYSSFKKHACPILVFSFSLSIRSIFTVYFKPSVLYIPWASVVVPWIYKKSLYGKKKFSKEKYFPFKAQQLDRSEEIKWLNSSRTKQMAALYRSVHSGNAWGIGKNDHFQPMLTVTTDLKESWSSFKAQLKKHI